MDTILCIVGILAMFIGLAGAILPLPGPPLSFLGLIFIHASSGIDVDNYTLWVLGLSTVFVTFLDYYAPIWGTKKFGGSKWGSYGSLIGLMIGLFFTPIGMFLGAFLGAFLGEYFHDNNQQKAFKAAVGSFIGLISGIVIKTILCFVILWYGISAIYQNITNN